MIRDELRIQYERKSDIELLLIATNYDGGYRSDAVETATSVLLQRYNNMLNLEQIWNEEVGHLFESAEKCSICQNPEVVYTKEFFLCSLASPDVLESGIGLATFIVLGVVREKYTAIKLEFRLCSQCLAKRTEKGPFREKVRISWQDYNAHPLCAFYKPLGYIDLRT
jgi:hypothetical protein